MTRLAVALLSLALLATPLAVEAQQAGKLHRIGYLAAYDRVGLAPYARVFRQALGELGWVEGQRVIIEERLTEGTLERLPALAADLVRLNVDVIFSIGTPAAVAAKHATPSIPIVMVGGDPVASGLAASLARPGGNVTGLSTISLDLAPKQLEVLKEVVPHASRVAVLWNPANPGHTPGIRALQAAAPALKVQLQPLAVQTLDDLEGAFPAMIRERADAVIVIDDGLFARHQERILAFAARRRLPAMYYFRYYVEAGGLMSYTLDLLDLHRRAAYFVDKILKGAKPADLPVEQPTKFELVVNLKTAKALGLTIPQSVLLRADEVIQ